ncbi:MAG: MBL fold metallo-hydrolase [Hyphomicrobium sp.]|nr:MAG: MBL fold metallo-hydrolase [Hyphomicrobium sp.]
MKLTVLGCGDAFGSGGQLQTSFHVAPSGGSEPFLIDCGATVLNGFDRAGLDPDRVSKVFITHLHGDHFGGLVWMMLHAQHVTRRTAPLTIVGPSGLEARFRAATEALYAGALTYPRRFPMSFVDIEAGTPAVVGGITVTAYEVNHPSGAASFALRLEAGEGADRRIIAFSGDTEWVDVLCDAARGADLFITECYGFDVASRGHLSWHEIKRHLPRIQSKRIMLTHMGRSMLAHRSEVSEPNVVVATDGQVLEV